jgi:hypothetical protein
MEKLIMGGKNGIITKLEEKAKNESFELNLSKYYLSANYSNSTMALFVSISHGIESNLQKAKRKYPNMDIDKQKEIAENWTFDKGEKGAKYTMKRNQAFESMIREMTWSDELADLFMIEEKDIVEYYSLKIYLTTYLNQITEQEFKEYVWQQATIKYTQEYQKNEEYIHRLGGTEKKGLLRAVLEVGKFKQKNPIPPRLYMEEQLFKTGSIEFLSNYNIIQLYKKLLSGLEQDNKSGVRKWRDGEQEITQYQYRKHKEERKRKLNELYRQNEYYSAHLFHWNDSNEAMTYINAVGRDRLGSDLQIQRGKQGYKPYTDPIGSYLRVTSLAQGKELIRIWIRWYNTKYQKQIQEAKIILDAVKEKNRRDSRLVENRLVKKQKDEQIILLHLTGLNFAQIAKQTGYAVRTVGDRVKKYGEVIELYVAGEDINNINTRTRIHLATIARFIEIHTDKEFPLHELPDATRENLIRQHEELKQAHDKILQQEVQKVAQIQAKKQEQARLDSYVRMHKEGLTPYGIARRIRSVTSATIRKEGNMIAGELKKMGVEPHFDRRFATNKQKEEHFAKQVDLQVQKRVENGTQAEDALKDL